MSKQTDNKDLLKKADLVLADMASNGGLLTPEQSDRFLEILLEQPTILGRARTVPMAAPVMWINKIGFGSRILRPAVENTALVAADRSKPLTTQIQLSTKEVIAEVRLPYALLEDNIEKGNLEDTILRLIGERAALDFEELVLLGDVTSSDPYLALVDGVLKRIVSNEVDGTTTHNAALTYANALKALPPRFKRNLNLLKLFVGYDTEADYRLGIAARQTILGDSAITSAAPVSVMGMNFVPVSYMPAETGFLGDPQNILIGIHRNFTIESQRLIAERQIQIVLTARVGLAIETEEAMVKIVNITPVP